MQVEGRDRKNKRVRSEDTKEDTPRKVSLRLSSPKIG